MTDPTAVFRKKAPEIMARLRGDFPLTVTESATIVGNAGYECLGFTKLQEIKPVVAGSRGGWGWMQWTGPRRRAFEAYCKRNRLDPASDKANYAWLFIELKGSERKAVGAVRDGQGIENKVIRFEQAYLRAGVKAYAKRTQWARNALVAYAADQRAPIPTSAAEGRAMLRDEARANDTAAIRKSTGAAACASGTGVGAVTAQSFDWNLLTISLVTVAGALVLWLLFSAIPHLTRSKLLKEAADAL